MSKCVFGSHPCYIVKDSMLLKESFNSSIIVINISRNMLLSLKQGTHSKHGRIKNRLPLGNFVILTSIVLNDF